MIALSAAANSVQEIFSLEFMGKRRSKESEDGGVYQRPGEIVERAKRPQIVHQRRRTRPKGKNKRPKGN